MNIKRIAIVGHTSIGREVANQMITNLNCSQEYVLVVDEPPFMEVAIHPLDYDCKLWVPKKEKTWEQPRRKNNYKSKRRKK